MSFFRQGRSVHYWPNASYMCFIGLSCQHPKQFFAGRPWHLWPCLVLGGIYDLFLIIVAIIIIITIIIIIILQPVQGYFALQSTLRSLGFLMRSDEMTSSSILMQGMTKRRYAPERFCDIDGRFPYIILSFVLCCVQNIFQYIILFIIILYSQLLNNNVLLCL